LVERLAAEASGSASSRQANAAGLIRHKKKTHVSTCAPYETGVVTATGVVSKTRIDRHFHPHSQESRILFAGMSRPHQNNRIRQSKRLYREAEEAWGRQDYQKSLSLIEQATRKEPLNPSLFSTSHAQTGCVTTFPR